MRAASATARAAAAATALDIAAGAMRARLGAAPGLVLIQSDCRHDPAVLAEAAGRLFPGAAVMGGSSCLGLMTEAGFAPAGREGPSLGLFGLADPDGAYGTGAAEFGGDPRAAAAAATEAALTHAGRPYDMPALVWLCAAPGAEEQVLAGIAEVLGPQVPVFGGSAADNDVSGGWWQIAGQRPRALRDGVALAVMFPSGRIGHAFQSGYEPTVQAGRVTASRGRELVSIDGEPAAEVYRRWTGGRIRQAGPGAILAESTWTPLAREAGRLDRVPFYLLAHPAQVTADGTLQLFAELPEGVEVTLMAGTEPGLLGRIGRVAQEAALASGLAPGQIRGAIAIYCGGCMLAIRPRMAEVVASLRQALPGVPFLGGFTFGEQGRSVTGQNLHGNLMISVIVFGD